MFLFLLFGAQFALDCYRFLYYSVRAFFWWNSPFVDYTNKSLFRYRSTSIPKWFLSINNFIFIRFNFWKLNGIQTMHFGQLPDILDEFRILSFRSFLMMYLRYSFIFDSRIHPLHSIQIKRPSFGANECCEMHFHHSKSFQNIKNWNGTFFICYISRMNEMCSLLMQIDAMSNIAKFIDWVCN